MSNNIFVEIGSSEDIKEASELSGWKPSEADTLGAEIKGKITNKIIVCAVCDRKIKVFRKSSDGKNLFSKCFPVRGQGLYTSTHMFQVAEKQLENNLRELFGNKYTILGPAVPEEILS
ncbi:TPA: hypothetical protein DEP21_02145 [Patescibacteria group bacterium]|nr:hypothetical protein [Candidatus Gracilibacteria bacterium]